MIRHWLSSENLAIASGRNEAFCHIPAHANALVLNNYKLYKQHKPATSFISTNFRTC